MSIDIDLRNHIDFPKLTWDEHFTLACTSNGNIVQPFKSSKQSRYCLYVCTDGRKKEIHYIIGVVN